MSCDDIIELLKVVIPILVSVISIFISANLAYRNIVRNSINQEKIELYSEVLDMLYELKGDRSLYLTNTEYADRLKKNRAKILLFSSKELFDEINTIYVVTSQLAKAYFKEREPESNEERETQIEKYSVTNEFIKKRIERLVEMMIKELKVKGKIKWAD